MFATIRPECFQSISDTFLHDNRWGFVMEVFYIPSTYGFILNQFCHVIMLATTVFFVVAEGCVKVFECEELEKTSFSFYS